MQITAILLCCLFAAVTVTAKPTEEFESLLKEFLQKLESNGETLQSHNKKNDVFQDLIKSGEDVQQRAIGGERFGGTTVGADFVELKVIRNMDEVKANTKTHKPKYSVLFGKGTHDASSSEHALYSHTWSELPMCDNGAEGCIKIPGLTPNTLYWFMLEVQMWENGAYHYVASRRDVKQLKTAKDRNVNDF